MAKQRRGANARAEKAGMPPVPYDGMEGTHRDAVPDRSTQTFVRPGPNSAGQRTSANRSSSGFNLRGVMEVLADAGYEPTTTVVEALTRKVPAVDRSGAVVTLADGTPLMVDALDPITKTKAALALMEFAHPKLKSVEMKVTETPLTGEQVDRRLVALLARHAQRAVG